MPKAEWGAKRSCQSCNAKFYDMLRTPIVCPACQTPYDIEQATRLKRARTLIVEEKAEPVIADGPDDDLLLDTDDDDIADDDAVLEDTSDLDDDDEIPGSVGDDGDEE